MHWLAKSDVKLSLFFSGVLGISSVFYVYSSRFISISQGNQILDWLIYNILLFPVNVFQKIYYAINIGTSHDPEGLSLGSAILAGWFAPLIVFIFWFLVFWGIARVLKNFTIFNPYLIRHLLALMMIAVVGFPLLFFSSDKNWANACFSGKLNHQFPIIVNGQSHSIDIGPEDCFEEVLDNRFGIAEGSKTALKIFCQGLSPKKKVWGTTISYQDHCLNYENNIFRFPNP